MIDLSALSAVIADYCSVNDNCDGVGVLNKKLLVEYPEPTIGKKTFNDPIPLVTIPLVEKKIITIPYHWSKKTFNDPIPLVEKKIIRIPYHWLKKKHSNLEKSVFFRSQQR